VTDRHALGKRSESDAALAELIRKYEREMAYNIAYVPAAVPAQARHGAGTVGGDQVRREAAELSA